MHWKFAVSPNPGFCLDNLNLTLPSGCILGLIGENGAGKTTTIKLILDMLRRDSGTVTILGRDNQDNLRLTKEDIGVVMDSIGLPEWLNARQIGKIMARIFARWDGEYYANLVESLGLPWDKKFKDFSRGMKMKLGIAVAMSHQPKLLLLDEPTGGLDPVARDQVVELFLDFTRQEDHAILIRPTLSAIWKNSATTSPSCTRENSCSWKKRTGCWRNTACSTARRSSWKTWTRRR